jgi:uncharacterized protein
MITPSFIIPRNIENLITKYFTPGSKAYKYYFTHCVKVTELAINIHKNKPELNIDYDTILAGGMLHDIGIIKTNAPEIGCFGEHPYIAHSYLGREILEQEGFQEIAPMCERHVGTGLSKEDIIRSNFPVPHRDMLPITVEEKLICYADKFYSKSDEHLLVPKSLDKIRKKVAKYGPDKLDRFEELVEMFGTNGIYEFNGRSIKT